MKIKDKECPFCNEKFSTYSHLTKCELNHFNENGIKTYFDLKLKVDCRNISEEYSSGNSLPELSKKYTLSISEVLRILKIFNVQTRTVKESNDSKTVEKRKKTTIERFGVENPSQSEIVKERKRETFLRNYGVDNIFKLEGFPEMVCEIMMQRYGKKRLINCESLRIARSKFTPEKYAAIDTKRKNTCLDRYGVDDPSKLPERRFQTSEMFKKWWNNVSDLKLEEMFGNNTKIISKPERIIWDILADNNIPFQSQRFVNKRSYDIYIHGTGILIEVQGDYWHANPEIYKAEDIISYPNKIKTMAKDVWERDLIKKQNAESYGFSVIYVWESEINFHKKTKTLDFFILNEIYNASKD